MKVTANLSFAGAELAMFRGEVRDVPEYIADPLLKCGYLAVVEPAAANSSEITNNELIQKAESMGVEVKSGWTKAEISAAIAAAAEA